MLNSKGKPIQVLLVNGSPNEHGCTHRALVEVQQAFTDIGVQSDIFWIGTDVKGCNNCRVCKTQKISCPFIGDTVQRFLELIDKYDGLIIGSPTYYASMPGQLQNFLTRCFYSACKKFDLKPCATVVCSRRSGSTNVFDQINKCFLMHNMIVVGSYYWNEVYGDFPKELDEDIEGRQCLRKLAYNMEYVIRGLSSTIPIPFPEKHVHTNFISREYLKLKYDNRKYSSPPEH